MIYPADDSHASPLASLRLAVQSDAFEDLALFHQLGGVYAQATAESMCRGPKDFDRNAARMEVERRKALAEIGRRKVLSTGTQEAALV